MTERLRAAIERSAADHHHNLHQILFYALGSDLIDLAWDDRKHHTVRNSVPAKEILALQAEYATAEHNAMRAVMAETLSGRKP